ncbi:hypothetical protein GN958_ATG08300 [Phytophthora infestans]|uniref:Uncharacterized protein n=1 Tax=Phytophthora infestans TaxID=4787 RepID=A0A8S9UNU9_PHYIN|nr:hypothetical protein GN958_ATG08300 [Phytophthora infestans]
MQRLYRCGGRSRFIATIEATASGLSGTFNGAPSDNTAAFTKAFESTSYSSLKEFINEKATLSVSDATLSCGSCDPDETAQPLPATAPNGLTPAALTTPVYCGMTPKLLELVVAPMDKENDYAARLLIQKWREPPSQPGGKVISVSSPENNSIKIVEVERQT